MNKNTLFLFFLIEEDAYQIKDYFLDEVVPFAGQDFLF